MRLRSVHLALLLALYDVATLVARPFALAETEFDLRLAIFEIHLERHKRQTLFPDSTK